MARSAHCFHGPTLATTTLALGLAAIAAGGCGLDRSGLGGAFLPDGAAPDLAFETILITSAGGHPGVAGNGGGGSASSGTGGAGAGGVGGPGSGGNTAGTGGVGVGGNGVGGTIGVGGNGVGGAIGVGGNGVGGMVGVGGAGAGGMIGVGGAGVGGMVGVGGAGIGGMIGVGGAGVGGVIGTGGQGVGGMVGTGGAGGAVTGACNSTTCTTGCCSGTVCITNLTPQLCGRAGVRCQACAPCERCGGTGACELDPASLWDLSAVSAGVNTVNPHAPLMSNGAWDAAGEPVGGPLPDPFVQIEMPSRQILGITATIPDTLAPDWSALTPATRAQVNPAGTPLRAGDLMVGGVPWLLWIGDDDVGVEGITLGEMICQIDGPLTAADFRAGGFMRSNVQSCSSASFKLTCHP